MKFTVHLKDPDGVFDSVTEAAEKSVASVDGLDDDERQALTESRTEELQEAIKPWFKWGEYLSVEIDTDAGTCTALHTA